MQNDLRVVASLDREVARWRCSRALPTHGDGGRLQVAVRPTAVEFCSGPVGAGVA
jgi:hypothetical protein